MTIEKTLTTSMRALGDSLKDFKESNDKRFERLERRPKFEGLTQTPPLLEAANSTPTAQKHFQHFLRGDVPLATKSLSAGEDPGSFAVPEYLQLRIKKDLEGVGAFRALANTLTISGSEVDLLLDANLPDAQWVKETGERLETDSPTLKKVRIMVNELYAKPCITQKLLEDAQMDVEGWLVHKVAQKMRRLENEAFLMGSGEQEPKGILAYASADPFGEGSTHFETIQTGKKGDFGGGNSSQLMDLLHLLPARYLDGAKWIMSSSALARIRKLRSPSGDPYFEHRIEEPFRMQVLGYPVILMEEMPPLIPDEATIPIMFGNFHEAYQIVDRTDMNILRDPYSRKPYVEFYMNKRVGGGAVDFDAVKLMHFSN